jgi:peptidyl-prolyl cis-trans isomerase SurA
MKINNLFRVFIYLSFCLLIVIVACSSKKKTVIAEIGDEKIYLGDYENQFLKTVGGIDSARKTTLEDRKDFLDLYLKFRLKVKDARERGLLDSQDIQNDLNEYKENFLTTFLIDKEVIEPKIKELHERKKNEIRASHILINLGPNPSPEDSIRAYEKASLVIQKLKDGVPFEEVALEFSEDNTVQQNLGDLYYFTAGMTVPEFEDAVFNMKPGNYTKEPVRTMFGLHIVKLTEKKSRVESVKASHILLQEEKDSLGMTIDSIGTYNKAKNILERIKSGEDFETLAIENSMDPGSAPKVGDLGFFERRRMVQPFDSAVFTMKIGEVSDLIRTPFGWHIIKVTDIKEYESFDKQKENLKAEFKRGTFYKTAYDEFVIEARKDLNYKVNEENFNYLISRLDTTIQLSGNNLDSIFTGDERNRVLAEYKGGKITIENMISYLNKNREHANTTASYATMMNVLNGASEMPLLAQLAEKENIEKDEEYIALLREYEDGLLSFKVDQEEIWSKIKLTNEDMLAYYNSHKDNYTFVSNDSTKYRAFDDVKSEISNILQQDKFREIESAYVESLKQKYPVTIYEEKLTIAFED